LREEVELESAARRYEQFYIRVLAEKNTLTDDYTGHGGPIGPGAIGPSNAKPPGSDHSDDGPRRAGLSCDHRARLRSVPQRLKRTPFRLPVDVSQKEQSLARYRLWFWVILLATFAVFPLVGYQVARHGIRPVQEMATTARHITSTNLRERILPEGYPFELASLAKTFNQMLDGLEESFERISKFSADIAHDLRTPVNNIRGETEVALGPRTQRRRVSRV
jgi:two-component system, OmpR family, heavy metal sensor histidine kinase CusS